MISSIGYLDVLYEKCSFLLDNIMPLILYVHDNSPYQDAQIDQL